MTRYRTVALVVVLVALLGYPLAAVAGGWPRFHSRDDCVHAATGDADDLEVVYGRLEDPVAAETLLDDVLRTGFVGTELVFDDCGRWKVSYDSIETFEQGQALAEEARRAGFEARVERG